MYIPDYTLATLPERYIYCVGKGSANGVKLKLFSEAAEHLGYHGSRLSVD